MLVKKDPDTIRSYLEDSSNIKGGCAEEVVIPETLQEVVSFLKDANSKRIPVTISGGGTGTTGSRVPFGGAVLSMERFNSIRDLSVETMSSCVQAGVLVEDLKDAAMAKGLFYVSHPTEKTAFVGGTAATNASGARSFKYGPTRKYVKRLKMVLAGGEVLEVRRGEKTINRASSRIKLDSGLVIDIPLPSYKMPDVKNSAGYFAKDGMDLIDLFVGQEGTLSVVTEIEIELVKRPFKILSSFVFFKDEPDAWEFSAEARSLSRERPHSEGDGFDALSIEYFDKNALELLRKIAPNIPEGADAAIFFEEEVTGENEDASTERWLELISAHKSSSDDTWVAMNEKDAEEFAKFRHHIPEAVNEMVRRNGYQKLSTDIAVPEINFARMMRFYAEALKGNPIRHVVFGHIGECHVHVNLLPRSGEELKKAKDICLSFAKKGVSLGGTVSAEHGIGKTRHKYLEIMYGRQGLMEMARIKKAFDPNCILGLDNIFPKEMLDMI